MNRTQKQKGFILLMVVALIPLVGMAAVVLTSNSRQLITQTRRSALRLHAQLACESGIAWIEKNAVNSLTIHQPLVLENSHEDKTITCTVEMISQTNEQSEFSLAGSATDNRFSCEYSQQLVLKRR